MLTDLQGVIRDGEAVDAVAVVLRRYPAPTRDLQAIDPREFEQFLELDRETWIAEKKSPRLDAHYQAERAKLTHASDYLNRFQDAVNFTARGQKLPECMAYERFRAAPGVAPEGEKIELRELKDYEAPAVPVAPDPVMPLGAPAPVLAPAAKPRTAPTGVPGKVQVLDW